MNTLRWILLILMVPVVVRGSGLTVRDDAAWRPATEEQRKAAANSPSLTLVDYSMRSSGGAGMVLRAPIHGVLSKQWVQSAVAGFVDTAEKAGMTVMDRVPGSVGKLRGICLTFKTGTGDTPFGAVSYLVFSDKDMYAISVYGPVGLTRSDPLVGEYLRRLVLDPTLSPGNIDRDSASELGLTDPHKMVDLVVACIPFLFGAYLMRPGDRRAGTPRGVDPRYDQRIGRFAPDRKVWGKILLCIGLLQFALALLRMR